MLINIKISKKLRSPCLYYSIRPITPKVKIFLQFCLIFLSFVEFSFILWYKRSYVNNTEFNLNFSSQGVTRTLALCLPRRIRYCSYPPLHSACYRMRWPCPQRWSQGELFVCVKKKKRHFEFVETTNDDWKLVEDALNTKQKSDTVGNPEFRAFTHSSSFVGNVLWDRESREMNIILNGKTYHFCNVSERLFDSFEGASSKGAFFNREIKTLHDC